MSVSERTTAAANVYEFFIVSAQEVAQLDSKSDTVAGNVPAVPPELDISNQQQEPKEQAWQTQLSQLPTSSAVGYQGWHKPFVLEGLPTRRRASYIINILTTSSKQQDLPPAEQYEIEQVARALLDAGIDQKLIQAKYITSKRNLNYEKWNSRDKL